MSAAAAIIETATLAKVILYSLAIGVGVAVVAAIGVSSAASLLDALRERRTSAGAAWGAVTTACVAITLAVIVLGLVVMTAKS